ncbi:MAG: hypothetical protein AABW87_01140 [Nanoarchaeota archaeon]
MKKILLALLIALPFIIAAFSPQLGFSWLLKQGNNGNYNNDIQASVLASLALKETGAVLESEQALSWVKSRQDEAGCFPAGSCNVKDTIFTYLLYYSFGEDTSEIDSWLKSAVSSALSNGNWWLQIATSSTGACKLSYTKNSESKEKTILVEQGRFPECKSSGPDTFFDLNKCIEPGLLSNTAFIEFDVDCSELGSAIISAVFQSGNTYYLLDEASTSTAVISINNGCFGQASKGACNIETSLYANWILAKAGSSLSVTPWLESNYNKDSSLHNSLLYLATKKDIYLNNLKALQKPDGSFQNVYDTALAVLAFKEAGNLDELSKASEWLKKQQKPDGSWNSKALDTALVLYAAFGEAQFSGGVSSCFNGIRDGDEGGVDCGGLLCGPCSFAGPVCGDNICDVEEDEYSCPSDCRRAAECIEDGYCDAYAGESASNCALDCFCGDGTCDSSESAVSCESDCKETGTGEAFCGNEIVDSPEEECDSSDDAACPGLCNVDCTCEAEEKSSLRWIIPLILILLIGFAIYFFWFMKKGKPGGGKSEKPQFVFQQPRAEQPAARIQLQEPKTSMKSKIEDELEKSLKEAKKLFGK